MRQIYSETPDFANLTSYVADYQSPFFQKSKTAENRKSIQVSKGAASVRNGYEGITGQIDVEYLKPEDDPGVTLNLYGNTDGRIEANADGNIHLTERLNANVLAHYEDNLLFSAMRHPN